MVWEQAELMSDDGGEAGIINVEVVTRRTEAEIQMTEVGGRTSGHGLHGFSADKNSFN